MRVIALISWFDERPDDLTRAVRSHADAGLLDAVVAVDGRYALFGSGTSESTQEEYDAITRECRDYGIDLVLVRREHPWAGEVDKRSALFRLGLALADVGRDWFWVVDADNELLEAPDADEVRAQLASTPLHVATVTLSEHGKKWPDVRRPMRQLFRALPGIGPYGRHFHYVADVMGEWKYLWGPQEWQLPSLELESVVVRHHTHEREQARRERSLAYYTVRDQMGVEVTPSWIVEDDASPGRLAKADREGDQV